MVKKRHWTFQISLTNIVLLILAFIINLLGDWISEVFKLPFWLDAIGTIFAASLLGPIAGGLVGGISGCVGAVMTSVTVIYALTNILVGIIVGIFYPEDETDIFQILCTGAIAAIVGVVVSTPVNLIFYQGYMKNLWGNALFEMLLQNGNGRAFSSVLGEALVDIPDKVISVFLAAGTARIWCRFHPVTKEERQI